MLQIKNLHAKIEDGAEILKGINLEIKPGEVHAIMGPNGGGKSTLASVLMGHPDYKVTSGEGELDNQPLLFTRTFQKNFIILCNIINKRNHCQS